MATRVFMEALSPTMEEGRLVKWLRNEGDAVKSGDVLAEVETDKAVMELVARGDGVLRKRLIDEGATAPVGQLVGVIAAPDENIASLVKEAVDRPAPAAPASETAPAGAKEPGPAPEQEGATKGPLPRPSSEGTGDGNGLRSSPLARRLASEGGLDLAGVQGSGPSGRIIKRDVEAALQQPQRPAHGARTAPVRSGAEYQDAPLTQIRKTIARRLAESIGPIPTFYLTAEFDLTRVSDLRSAMTEFGDEYRISVNDIMMKAVATALSEHPECNAHWLGDRIRYFNRVHLGMAVATDDGLIVPVIFDADTKPMRVMAQEARELAARARDRKLTPEEYTGSTFSVSNLGMFGIDQFTAIINPPESGILAIGTLTDKPVLANGDTQWRKRLRVTMSCDHRVIDGAAGARFLQTLRRMLENPLMLVY
jgi:pyruvate dehydrogenase E2 component (dihydrolipoamide acetyltransferase)